jgi:hypothetical protein
MKIEQRTYTIIEDCQGALCLFTLPVILALTAISWLLGFFTGWVMRAFSSGLKVGTFWSGPGAKLK